MPQAALCWEGVLSLSAQVEMQQRASTAAIYQSGANGVKLDPVLRAHLGLDAFKERRDA